MRPKKSDEQIAYEKAQRFPKDFYDLPNLLGVFSEKQLAAITEAIREKANRHKGLAAMTKNSGYGTASTREKYIGHLEKAEYYNELETAIQNSTV